MIEKNVLLHTFTNVLITLGTAIILLVTTFTIGPYVEGKYFPITQGFEITLRTETKDKMTFSAVGTKTRQCALREIRALVGPKGVDSVKNKGAIWVEDDGMGPIVRPLGKQDLGIWAIQPAGDRIDVYASYTCHGLWTTESYLGHWERGEKFDAGTK